MLIPIGKEDKAVRRHPWVSYAIIFANLLVFMNVNLGPLSVEQMAIVQKAAAPVLAFIDEHPYVDVPWSVSHYLPPTWELVQSNAAQLWADTGRTPTEQMRREAQAEISEYADALAGLDVMIRTAAWAFRPSHPDLLTLITHQFIHGGWMHVAGNLLFFLFTGPYLEDRLGRAFFAVFYLAAGACAALTHMGASPAGLIGASGAIAGVMGAFVVRLGNDRIRFLFLPVPFVPFLRWTFFARARTIFTLWILEQVVSARLMPQAGVAWWAHIGGFAFGVVVLALVRVTRIEERFIHPAIEAEISIVQHEGVVGAHEARLAGDLATASTRISAALAAQPLNVDAWTEAYEVSLAAGRAREAGARAVKLLGLHIRSGERDLVHALVQDVEARLGPDTPFEFLFKAAQYCEQNGLAGVAVRLLEAVVARDASGASGRRAQASLRALGVAPAAEAAAGPATPPSAAPPASATPVESRPAPLTASIRFVPARCSLTSSGVVAMDADGRRRELPYQSIERVVVRRLPEADPWAAEPLCDILAGSGEPIRVLGSTAGNWNRIDAAAEDPLLRVRHLVSYLGAHQQSMKLDPATRSFVEGAEAPAPFASFERFQEYDALYGG